MEGGGQVIKWLWTANGTIFGLALLVLIIGLVGLAGPNPLAGKLQSDSRLQNADGNGPLAADGNGKESPLVAMARKYSVRFNPPKPKPKAKPPKKSTPSKKPPPPKKVTSLKKPSPPKKSPPPKKVAPPPKPVIPPPSFTVEATLMIGERDGLAWIKPPKAMWPNLYAAGEKIDQYEIVKIENGLVELVREKKIFTIKIPEPKKAVESPLPPVVKKKPIKKNSFRRSRKRQTRPLRTDK